MQGLRSYGGITPFSYQSPLGCCRLWAVHAPRPETQCATWCLKAEVIIERVESIWSIRTMRYLCNNNNNIRRSMRWVHGLSLLRSAQPSRISPALKLPVEHSILATGGGRAASCCHHLVQPENASLNSRASTSPGFWNTMDDNCHSRTRSAYLPPSDQELVGIPHHRSSGEDW